MCHRNKFDFDYQNLYVWVSLDTSCFIFILGCRSLIFITAIVFLNTLPHLLPCDAFAHTHTHMQHIPNHDIQHLQLATKASVTSLFLQGSYSSGVSQ